MAKLIGFESREVRSVEIDFGDTKIPAKVFAKSLLPQNLSAVQQAFVQAQELARDEKKGERTLRVKNKLLNEQIADDKIPASKAEKTRVEIEAIEADLQATRDRLNEVLKSLEDWNYSAISDIDLVEPRADLTDAEMDELARLEAEDKLTVDSPLVTKVPFTRERMSAMLGEVKVEGAYSMAPLTFFSAIVAAAEIKKTKSSGSVGR